MATLPDDHHSQWQQLLSRRRRLRCWTNGDSSMQRLLPPLPKRSRSCGGLSPSLLIVISILATRLSSSEAGLTELSLPYGPANRVTAMTRDSDGNLFVGGCAVPTERSARVSSALNAMVFVEKYAQTGEQLWRREFDSAAGIDGDGQGDCSSVFIAADANANVFLAGTTIITSVSVNDASHEDLSDTFVAKMTASGDLLWRKTLGTAQRDEATAIRVDPTGSAVYVTGFSGGDLTQQKSSSSVSNCVHWRSTNITTSQSSTSTTAAAQECLAGVVLKLETRAGELQWVHQVVSQTSDRVFGVDGDGNGSLVVVGDTKGDLRQHDSVQRALAPVSHAGDLFVQKLDERTGEALWTTQLGSAATAADLCRLPGEGGPGGSRRRGNCGIALAPSSASSLSEPIGGSVYLTGTTFGVISTLEQDLQQYVVLCDSSKRKKQKQTTRFFETPNAATDTNDCAHQAMLAKVRITNGKVEWVRQVVTTPRNSAEGLARLPAVTSSSSGSGGSGGDESVVVLGLADPGFLSSSELEQLFVLRVTAHGETQWLQEMGLSGEDRALDIATEPSTAANESVQLLVMGVGNHETSRVASENDVLRMAYARKLNPLNGHSLPFCEDSFSFQTNATSVQQLMGERVVISVTVERSNEHCGGDSSVAYAIERSDLTVNAAARPGVDFVASKGLVNFAARQKSATVAVINVLPATSGLSDGTKEPMRTLTLVLERVSQVESVLRTPFRMEITIQMAAIQFPSTSGDGENSHEGAEASNGHFWRWLSRICALVIGLVLVLTVALGWLCSGICGCTCLRKAKVFQYKRIKSPRASNHAGAAEPRGGLDEPSMRKKSGSQALKEALELSRSRSPRSSGSFKASELEGEVAEQEEEEEDEELRGHLNEIQQLNNSLEALILNSFGAQRRRASANEDESPAVLQAKISTSCSSGVVAPILSAAPVVGPLSAAALANVGGRRSKARKKSAVSSRLLANLFSKKKKSPSPSKDAK